MSDSESSRRDEQSSEKSKISWHVVVLLCAVILSAIIGSNMSKDKVDTKCNETITTKNAKKPSYWVFSQSSNVNDRSGILKHVHIVLDRLGFVHGTNESDWDLLWSHDFPFRAIYPQIRALKKHQRVNHFPGTGFITNKVDFATSESKFIPKAFKIPEDKEKFKAYAEENPQALFVQKHNQHRHVTIKNISQIDLDGGENFVQEYVKKPFLVDGHKFDIGVYTIITSVDPLRVYIYKGDILFRYCPSKYYPFDSTDIDKYVIGDDYLPTWEVPSLAPLYTAMGYGMRDSFEAYVTKQGKDPSIIWKQVDEFLGEIFLKKEHHIIAGLKNYKSGTNFFEMMRFDFVIDEDLNLYALEANMSPNLSSAHYPPNQLLYEQVLFSTLALVGIGKYTHSTSSADRDTAEARMRVTDKNLGVWANRCQSEDCRDECEGICETCRHCLTPHMRQTFTQTVLEQLNRNDCKRVYPAPMVQGVKPEDVSEENLSQNNYLMHLWLQGKCNQDVTWCN